MRAGRCAGVISPLRARLRCANMHVAGLALVKRGLIQREWPDHRIVSTLVAVSSQATASTWVAASTYVGATQWAAASAAVVAIP